MRHGRAGFTLVEVLAAMIFLGILGPVVISGLLTASRAGEVAERSTIAAHQNTPAGQKRTGRITGGGGTAL